MPTVIAPTRIKLQNILFATDFSASAQSALSSAINLARRYDAGVYIVNVLPHLPFVESPQPDPEETRLLAKEQIAALIDSGSFGDVKHKELIEEGEVSEVLSQLVRKYAVDLVVMGTCGRKGFGKLLLGSVAEEVFRNAECPVLTIGPHAAGWEGNLRHILYATDSGPESIHAVPYAISLAEENGARLTLLHVAPEPALALPEPEPGAMPVIDRKEVVATTKKQLRSLIPEGTLPWQELEFVVQFGEPAETIVRIASEAVDMIVLGVKRPTALTKHLGAGVAYQVACDAPCPVLSVSARYHA
ncbi:MAG TPA: universal stress protein [Terriglobales bacterium]|nr:universal stress protein [Terriglobales bacterium]